jgi:integrase
LFNERFEKRLEQTSVILGVQQPPQSEPPVEPSQKLQVDDSPKYDDAIVDFLELKAHEVGPKALQDWTTSLKTFSAKLGKKRLASITVEDIESVIKPLWKVKAYMTNRSLARLAKLFSWAKARGYYKRENPALWRDNFEYRLPNPQKIAATKSYPALPWDKAHDFYRELDQRDTIGAIALKLVVLTGQRSGQIRQAKWQHIDFKKKTWTFPAENMKKRIAHTIPIDDIVIKVLKTISKTDSDDLFNVYGKGPITDPVVSSVIIDMNKKREASGRPTWHDPSDGRTVKPHGFRTTLRMWGADKEHNRQAMEFQLAHKIKDKVEAAYQRSNLLEVRRKIMSEWTDLVVNGK